MFTLPTLLAGLRPLSGSAAEPGTESGTAPSTAQLFLEVLGRGEAAAGSAPVNPSAGLGAAGGSAQPGGSAVSAAGGPAGKLARQGRHLLPLTARSARSARSFSLARIALRWS
jgi:hypothetical protein